MIPALQLYVLKFFHSLHRFTAVLDVLEKVKPGERDALRVNLLKIQCNDSPPACKVVHEPPIISILLDWFE
jgi:hypothetical protein